MSGVICPMGKCPTLVSGTIIIRADALNRETRINDLLSDSYTQLIRKLKLKPFNARHLESLTHPPSACLMKSHLASPRSPLSATAENT